LSLSARVHSEPLDGPNFHGKKRCLVRQQASRAVRCIFVGVRKTETRLPAGFAASDLGEAAVATDGRCALVSFLASALTPGQENTYVLFVTDPGLAASVDSYEWLFAEDGAFPQEMQTKVGTVSYTPSNIGNLTVIVRILDSGESELASLTLVQDVGPLNPALETLIEAANVNPGPGISNPEVIREIVNAYYSYYQNVVLKVPETGSAFKQYVCSFICDGILKKTLDEQGTLLDQLADALESNQEAFPIIAMEGVGVCRIRLALLAMTFPSASPLLPWTELPQDSNQNAVADEQLRQKLRAVGDDDKIDLLNVTRFPKTNINQCAKILEILRDKYFPGTNFDDVLTGLSGTRQQWIAMHYAKGPLAV
jgi:hypothetical protein